MPSVWIQALREHNSKGTWCVPKKGTAEYEKVKVIMDRMKRGEPKPSSVKEQVKKIEKKIKKDKKSMKIKI
jgi:hypothetical protein